MRLFVAVWPDRAVLDALEAVPRPPSGVRWTTPDQWHVTLAFLGEVAPPVAEAIPRALALVARELDGPLRVQMGPATRRLGPSVLCVPVSGLDGAALAVQRRLRALGLPIEDRLYRGHLTLARGRGGGPVPRTLSGTPIEGSWLVSSLDVVRSTLGPGGARYETVARATIPS